MDVLLDTGACLDQLDFQSLTANRTGMEREMLRVTAQGQVARTPHPAGLGDKLTHPRLTVDFSEGLLELVSQPHARREAMLAELRDLQAFTARHLPPGELGWALSMPPTASEADVLIADFGSSQSGRMKEVYRQGLASRYGRVMQIIAGVHYNFSFDPAFLAYAKERFCPDVDAQDCRSQVYFRLIRGFDRYAWMLPYLFGASPVAAKSSLGAPCSWLPDLDDQHVVGEFATSLRMSDIGYQSPAQADLSISHRSIADYVRELVLATRTPWPEYELLGLRDGEEWVQLNANILQIENEYYSAVRPKQITRRGERPACALFNRGVQYVEIRMLDVDPFEPLGMSAQTADFLEVFLLSCLVNEQRGEDYTQQDKNNQKLAIRYGRRESLKLMRGSSSIRLRDWAEEILEHCAQLAERLDQAVGGRRYAEAVAAQRAKLANPALLPSQRVMDESEAFGGYADWALEMSRQHTAACATMPITAEALEQIEREVEQSRIDAAQLAAEQTGPLEEYVDQYYNSLCSESLRRLL